MNEILEALGLRAKRGAQTGNQSAAKNKPPTVGGSFDPYDLDSKPVLKTTADLAGEIGLSPASARSRLQVARSLASDVKGEIGGTPLADSTSNLIDLARLDSDEQRAVIAMDGVKEGRTSVRFARRKLGEQRARERAEGAGGAGASREKW